MTTRQDFIRKTRPKELSSLSRGVSVALEINRTIREKRYSLERENLQLEHTSRELVCALGWISFPNHVMSVEEKRYVSLIFTKVGYTLKNRQLDPQYAFTLHQKMLMEDDAHKLRYYEGFLKDGDEVKYHAWCTLHGKVADLATTLEIDYYDNHVARRAQLGFYPDFMDYAGREIPRKLVQDLYEERKAFLPVLQMYEYGYGDIRAGKLLEEPI
jgi:hypothetical protein